MSIKTLLELELEEEFNALSEEEKGSDKYKTITECAAKLMDRALELEKLENERQEREMNREFEHDLKLKQFKDEKRDRVIRNCIAGAGVLFPILLTIWGTKVSLKFEEEGTITTAIGRGFINRLLPKK